VLWVALGATILLVVLLGGFWWGTRPSIWDQPRDGAPAGERDGQA
jgi:hypothetical protein